jgi:hypothetical protein
VLFRSYILDMRCVASAWVACQCHIFRLHHFSPNHVLLQLYRHQYVCNSKEVAIGESHCKVRHCKVQGVRRKVRDARRVRNSAHRSIFSDGDCSSEGNVE